MQELQSPFVESKTPRLSVLHLLLWTLGSAVYLGANRIILPAQADSAPQGMLVLQQSLSIPYGIIFGAVWTAMYVLVSMPRTQGMRMLRQPGHWLLLATGVVAALMLVAQLIVALLTVSSIPHPMLIFAGTQVVALVIYATATWQSNGIRWKLFFALHGGLAIMHGVFFTGMALNALSSLTTIGWFSVVFATTQILGMLLLPIWIVAVSIADWAASRRRDWLHWVGVGSYLATIGMIWITRVWLWLT